MLVVLVKEICVILHDFNRRLEGDAVMNTSGNITRENSGNTHFSATSIRELGRRYFYFYDMIK